MSAPWPQYTEADRRLVFAGMEKLADRLCQTQSFILKALHESGLKVVPLAPSPAPADGGASAALEYARELALDRDDADADMLAQPATPRTIAGEGGRS